MKDFEGSNYEATQFFIQRLLANLEFGMILKNSIVSSSKSKDDKVFVKWLNRTVNLGNDETLAYEPSKNRLGQQENLVAALAYLFTYDPAVYLGFPKLDKDDLGDLKELHTELVSPERRVQVARTNAMRCIDFLNKSNAEIISDISSMPLFILNSYAQELVRDEDQSLRWKTLWALSANPMLTRLDAMAQLKYQSREEIEKDWPDLFVPKKEGGMGYDFHPEKIGFIHDQAVLSIINYRAHIFEINIEENPDFGFDQLNGDLMQELEIDSHYIESCRQDCDSKDGIISSLESRIDDLKSDLKGEQKQKKDLADQLATVVSDLSHERQIKATPVIITETKEIAGPQLYAAKDRILVLEKEIIGFGERERQLLLRLEQANKTAGECEQLYELSQQELEIFKFYHGKNAALILRDGFSDSFSSVLQQFGMAVQVWLNRRREIESLASSKSMDVIFAPLACVDHTVTQKLPGFKTIFYDKSSGPVHLALYRNIKRLRNNGMG